MFYVFCCFGVINDNNNNNFERILHPRLHGECAIAEPLNSQYSAVVITFMALPAMFFAIVCLACVVKGVLLYTGHEFLPGKTAQIPFSVYTRSFTYLIRLKDEA